MTPSDPSSWPPEMHFTVEAADPEFSALLFTKLIEGGAARTPQWQEAWTRRLSSICFFDDRDLELDGQGGLAAAYADHVARTPAPWSDRFSPDELTSFHEWMDRIEAAIDDKFPETPSAALVEAWRRGLNHFVVIPVDEHVVHKLGAHRMLVSHAVWSDPAAFDAAVTGWSG